MTAALDHLSPKLRQILDRLPREPGVYLLKDRAGKIVYVGKAKNLFARVRSYFVRSSSDDRAFVPLLERIVADVEILITHNEKEALLTENTLIKRHQPRFNVKLRDDKSFLVLRLDPSHPYPRLEVTRRILDDGARYFGPYHSATACRQTLRLVNQHFQLRTCTDRTLARRKRPCLQYQIQRCPGPCIPDLVGQEEYAQQVEDVALFLRGRGQELIRSLQLRMEQAAERLAFEVAARIRDQIAALRTTQQSQQVVSSTLIDQDLFGFYREGDKCDLVVLLVREGKLVARQPFSISGQEFPDDEVLSSFISRYYDQADGNEQLQPERSLPRQIVVPFTIEDRAAKEEWLAELRGGPVELIVPLRGKRRQLLALAQRNARSNFQTRRQRRDDQGEAMARIQHRLRLKQLPRRIECYDISGFHGELVVASMVTFADGEPQRSAYRRFKVRSPQGDDFSSIYEVLRRRVRRARSRSPGWELPDLIIIDGGKAQLSAALTAIRDEGVPDGSVAPAVVALAKERPDGPEGKIRPERIFLPKVKDPILLRPYGAETFLLTRIRDEAHRFAITFHQQLRRKRGLRSSLEEIPGIGPKRQRELLRALGSLKRIQQATAEELAAVPKMTAKAAEVVERYFASLDPEPAVQGAPHQPRETDESADD